MNLLEKWAIAAKVPAVRRSLFMLGLLLMAVSPAAAILPGPGGILVFAGGLALTLKHSEWAKRKYVAFKRRHPRKAGWTDWGMRRQSAARREALRRQRAALEAAGDD